MKYWRVIILCLILILTFLIRAHFVSEAFEGDQGIYAYIGWGWEHGKVLYRDLVDNKPPLVFAFYRIIFKLFGHSVEAIRLVYSLLAVLTTLALYGLARSVFKPGTALLGTFLYGLFSGGALIVGSFPNAENLMVFFIILAFYLFWRACQQEKNFLFLLCGIFIGLAAMTKQSALLEGMGMSVFLYSVYPFRKSGFLGLKRIGLLWLGAGIVFSLVFAYLISKGTLKDFVNSTVLYGLFYARAAGVTQSAVNFFRALSWTPRENFPLWVLAGLGVVLAFKKKDRVLFFLLIWLISAFLGVAITGRFYPQYFIQAMPPLALVAAYTLEKLFWQPQASRRKKSFGAVVLALALIVFVRAQWNYYFKYDPDESLINRRGKLVRPLMVKANAEMAAFIRERTKPDDYIYIWGFWPEIYFLSQRYSSSKYAFLAARGVMIKHFASLVKRQVLADTIKNKPVYFIIDPHFAVLIDGDLGKYLEDYYYLDREIGGCRVLRRKGP